MPENLTFTHQILKEHTVDTLEGHTVVVLENTGSNGEKYRYELQPGQEPKARGLLERMPWRTQPKYFAYAVAAAPFLSAQFGADVKMDDMLHAFTLKIELTYSVSEPRLVVIGRNRDPLKVLRDAVVGTLQKRIASYPWINITNDFRRVERDVVDDTISAVRQIAASVGLRVQDISLSHDVPRTEIADIVEIDAHKLAVLRAQNNEDLAKYRRAAGRFDAAANALNTAITNAAGSVRNPAELIQALTSVNAFLQEIRNGGDDFADGSHTLPSAANTQNLLLAAANQSGLPSVLIEVVSKTEQLTCAGAVKRQLQSALLHLIAALLPEEQPEEELIKNYRKRVVDAAAQASLSAVQSDYFESVINPRKLRERLQ